MPAVQMRDLPQDTYNLLCKSAKESGRSINQQLKFITADYFRLSQEQSTHSDEIPDSSATPLNTKACTISVNPFDSINAPIEARRIKRQELFSRIASREYPDSTSKLDTIAIVREMRDER